MKIRHLTGGLLFSALMFTHACSGGAQTTEFARTVERLSEPGGFFDTDNLISNETSYLHVAGELEQLGVRGGAYLGVGPDQNFSYIALIRPEVAYIVDIRRDNMLEHLIYRAIFMLSANRVDYLSYLFGMERRSLPAESPDGIDELLAVMDRGSRISESTEIARTAVDSVIRTWGLQLDERDWQTIDRFHRTFIRAGLSLRFNSFGRAPQPYYPTYRELFTARDLEGDQEGYLTKEGSFQFVKDLQERGLIIPVVGDFAGEHALAAIASDIGRRGLKVSAFYTSNVEFYLMRNGLFDAFARNVSGLPADSQSVFIRSLFNSTSRFVHPKSVPGFASTQLLQRVDIFEDLYKSGTIRSYADLVLP